MYCPQYKIVTAFDHRCIVEFQEYPTLINPFSADLVNSLSSYSMTNLFSVGGGVR
jgi:hypothetical protein